MDSIQEEEYLKVIKELEDELDRRPTAVVIKQSGSGPSELFDIEITFSGHQVKAKFKGAGVAEYTNGDFTAVNHWDTPSFGSGERALKHVLSRSYTQVKNEMLRFSDQQIHDSVATSPSFAESECKKAFNQTSDNTEPLKGDDGCEQNCTD